MKQSQREKSEKRAIQQQMCAIDCDFVFAFQSLNSNQWRNTDGQWKTWFQFILTNEQTKRSYENVTITGARILPQFYLFNSVRCSVLNWINVNKNTIKLSICLYSEFWAHNFAFSVNLESGIKRTIIILLFFH